MDHATFRFVLEIIAFTVLVVGGVVWLRSDLTKERCKEAQELADTRGDRIQDLENHQKRMEIEIAELRGQVDMLRQLKTSEIIDGVVGGIIPFLQPASEK